MPRYASSDLVIYATDSHGQSRTVLVDRESLFGFVTETLLETYNSHWRDPESPPLAPDEFRDRIELPAGSIEVDVLIPGQIRISLEANGLFCDQGITVVLDRTGSLLAAMPE